jgi:hypothetical protein
MASRYDTPLQVGKPITPFALPVDTIDESLASQQKRYEDVLNTQQALGTDILKFEARPVSKEDQEFIKDTYSDYDKQSLDYLSSLEGNFGALDVRKLGTIAQDILVPKRDVMSAMQHNNEIFKMRKELKAKLGDRGLDFDDSADYAPTLNSDGSVNVFNVGIEERLDWYAGIERLFGNIKDHSIIKETYDPTRHGDDYGAYAMKKIKQLTSNQTLYDAKGNITIAGRLQNAMTEQVDEYLMTDQGDQQLRWYIDRYMKTEGNDRIAAGEDEQAVKADAEKRARDKIQRHIFDIGDTFKTRNEKLSEMMTPLSTKGKGKETGDDDEEDKIEIQFSSDVQISGSGSKYKNAGELGQKIEQLSADYNPAIHDGIPFEELRSIDAINNKITMVGPDRDDHTMSQFKDKGSQSRGQLQLMELQNGRNMPTFANRYDPTTDRTVFFIDNTDSQQLDAYREYVENHFEGEEKKRRIAQLDNAIAGGEPPMISALEIVELPDGRADVQISPFLLQNKEIYDKEIERASKFRNTPQNIDGINKLMSTRQSAITEHRSAIERHKSYVLAANMTLDEFEEMKDQLVGSDSKYDKAASIKDKYIARTLFTNIPSYLWNKSEVGRFTELLNYDKGNDKVYARAVYDLFNTALGQGPEFLENIGGLNGYRDYLARYFETKGLDPNYELESAKFVSGPMIEEANALRRFSGVDYWTMLESAAKRTPEEIQKKTTEADMAFYDGLGDMNAKMKEYVRLTKEGSQEWEYDAMSWIFPANTPEQLRIKEAFNKFAFDMIASQSNKLYPSTYNKDAGDANLTDPEKQKGFTIYEAIQRAIEATGNKNLAKKFTEIESISDFGKIEALKDKFNIHSLTFDNEDGLVANLNIFGTLFEIRDIEGISNYMIDAFDFPKHYIDLSKKAAASLKENDYNMGRLGNELNPASFTEFFVSQGTGTAAGIPKGHYYIYMSDGEKKEFKNVFELIDWHRENKQDPFKMFNEAATPLAMPENEWKYAMPNVDRDEYKKYLADMFIQHQDLVLKSSIAKESGFSADQFTVTDYGRGKQHYLNNPKTTYFDNKFTQDIFKEEDLNSDGNTINYTMKDPDDYGNINDVNNSSIVTIGPVSRALDQLDEILDDQDFNITITQSVRSIGNQMAIYKKAGKWKKGKYSPHMQGMSVDVRSIDEDGQKFLAWLKTKEGMKWLKDNNLRAYHHKVKGNEYHIDISLNYIDSSGERRYPYIIKDEADKSSLGSYD